MENLEKTQRQMLQEVYQAVIGIPNNPDENGIIGDVREIKVHLQTLNGQVARNTMFRKIGTWVSTTMVGAIITLAVAYFKSR